MKKEKILLDSDEDYEALGKEMVYFVVKNDCYHVSEWYQGEKLLKWHEMRQLIKNPIFEAYYQKALAFVSRKYLDGTINPTVASKFVKYYFRDLYDHEKEEERYKQELELEYKKRLIEYDIQLKAKVSQLVSDEIRLQYQQTIAQITALQQGIPPPKLLEEPPRLEGGE